MSYKRDFVKKDYESFRQYMLELIPEYTPEWTDKSQSDFGVVLIEDFANALDILSYYQDTAVRENLMTTAERRQSIRELAQFLGYPIDDMSSAKVAVEFTKYDDLIDEEVKIPKLTQVATADKSVIYEALESGVIPAGSLSAEIVMTQGESRLNDALGKSNGELGQTFRLTYPDSLKKTIEVRTLDHEGAPIEWEQVDSFVDADTDDRVFTVYKEDDFHYIQFSEGMSGKTPEENYRIVADYRTSLGADGNVGVETLTKLITNVEGVKEVTNHSTPFILGKTEERKESIKDKAPRNWRTNDRVVTASDFEDYAVINVEDVISAKTEETYNDTNDVILHVSDTDYSVTLPTELVDEIKSVIEPKMIMNNNLIVQACTYVDWTIAGTLEAKDNFILENVEQEVLDVLENNFNVAEFDFNEKAKIIDILYEIRQINGVDNFDLTSPATDVAIAEYEVANLTQISVNDKSVTL